MSFKIDTRSVLYPSADIKSQLLKTAEISIEAIESDVSELESSSDSETNSASSSINSVSLASEKPVDAVNQKTAADDDHSATSCVAAVQPKQAQCEESTKLDEDVEVAYDGRKPPMPRTVANICEDVLGVLARYRLVHQRDTSKVWGAKAKFLAQVERSVVRGEPVLMSLPAFPFKSPNKKTKVLGTLPDKGEEVALSHLEGLCLAIRDVYEPGANVFIVSDGLMYSDILGIPDLEVWRYGQALRKMARSCGCDHVQFLRLRNLLGAEGPVEPITEEEYLRDAPKFRNDLLARYLPEDFNVDAHIAKDADTTLTYRGYIKFLETDLATMGEERTKSQMKNHFEATAKKMIVRGKAFATAIARSLSNHIRLSIHPSTEQSKLSMSIIPQTGRSVTPWHGALIRAVDGSITMSHAASVSALTHELIFDKQGRPSYFRERSDLFDWPGMDVDFNYIYPTGIVVTPRDSNSRYSFHNVHMQKVRALSEACSPVVLRGFTDTTDQHTFEAKAYDCGTVQPWTFGIRQSVKDSMNPDPKASTVTSTEAMPMHYDGFFFLKKEIDPMDGVEKLVSKVPRFQYFTAITPSPPGDGMTLFASSKLFFQHLPAPYTLQELETLKWDCKHSHNWSNHMKDLALVVPHPTNGKPCVRWHEPWYQWMTKFSTNEIRISNGGQHYKDLIREMLYDRRVCLYFNFEQADILLADNISMMHTRSAFTPGTGRELWRIHIN
ncbi:MAG: hypothetical protein Q9202_006837 [Teloschistes flavicans]